MLDKKPDSVGKQYQDRSVYSYSEGNGYPGERGILHVRGPHVMLGYWNNPD